MTDPDGPVVVGGVGGSGTRLVADILVRLGFYMGRDLNASLDNLWFTLLFRRPRWYQAEVGGDESGIMRTLGWFEDAMLGRLDVVEQPGGVLDDAVEELVSQGLDRSFVEERRRRFLQWGASPPSATSRWGWKEPNSHIFLEFLDQHFGARLRYVHVIRHGVEVARRQNRLQLLNWGWLFGVLPSVGISPGQVHHATAAQALDYWIAANSRVMSIGPRLLGDRFHVVTLDTLREDPVPVLGDLCRFLGQRGDPNVVELLARLPRPAREARPTTAELAALSEAQRRGLGALGFPIPDGPRS